MEWFPLLLALGVHKFNFRGEMPKIVDETAGIRNTAVEFFSGLVKWRLVTLQRYKRFIIDGIF